VAGIITSTDVVIVAAKSAVAMQENKLIRKTLIGDGTGMAVTAIGKRGLLEGSMIALILSTV
jgi:hypothetical protein